MIPFFINYLKQLFNNCITTTMSNNLIKLIYSLNNEESSVAFDPSNKIGSLKTLINLTQKINLDDYEVFYRKKEIKWTDETPIKNIIGKENVPIFYIKLKASKSNDNKNPDNKPKEDKKTDKPNDNEKKIESGKTTNNKEPEKKPDPKAQKDEPKKVEKPAAQGKELEKKNDKSRPNSVDNNQKELTHLKCKVIVEDFPSRPEFFELIDKYKANKQIDHEMHLLNTATGVEISFKNPDLAYDFLKYINLQKVNNPLYTRLRTNLVLDAKKVRKPSALMKKTGMVNRPESKQENNSLDTSKMSPMLNNEPNSRFFKQYNQVSKSQNFKELAMFEHFNKIKDEKLKHKLLKKYYRNANFVSLASPYSTEEERVRKETLDKKKLWIDKRGFNNALQRKPIISPIPNYINLDHYGVSAISHKFRHDFKEKAKWIDKSGKNFFV